MLRTNYTVELYTRYSGTKSTNASQPLPATVNLSAGTLTIFKINELLRRRFCPLAVHKEWQLLLERVMSDDRYDIKTYRPITATEPASHIDWNDRDNTTKLSRSANLRQSGTMLNKMKKSNNTIYDITML